MLLLVLRQLAVCVSLFALLILSVDLVNLLCANKIKKERSRETLFVVTVLWAMTLFGALYEGLFLTAPAAYGFGVVGGGLVLLLPGFCLYFGQAPGRKKKELGFVSCFYAVSVLNLFVEAYFLCDILRNLFVVLLGIHVAKQLPFFRKMGAWADLHFAFLTLGGGRAAQTVKQLRTVWLSAAKEKEINEILDKKIYCSKLTLEALSREVGVNKAYASKYFNRQQHASYPQYTKMKRMAKVEEELKTQKGSIIEIYESAGFASSTFFATFKARHEVTPEQWRRNNAGSVSPKGESDSGIIKPDSGITHSKAF